MPFTLPGASPSPPAPVGTVTRATADGPVDPTEPSLRSGFASVMEQEHQLQSSTGGYRQATTLRLSSAIARILSKQQVALGANIALLEQRFETLPRNDDLALLPVRLAPPAKARHVASAPEHNCLLRNLVAQHLNILENIDTLLARGLAGQRGELILTEVARNHEEMAGMLTALLKEDESMRDGKPLPAGAAA